MSRASGLKTRKSRNLWHLPKNRPSKQNSLGMAACQEIGHGRHIERWEVGDEMFQSIQMTSLDMVNICKNLHIVIILMIMTIISINTSLSIIIQCFFLFCFFPIPVLDRWRREVDVVWALWSPAISNELWNQTSGFLRTVSSIAICSIHYCVFNKSGIKKKKQRFTRSFGEDYKYSLTKKGWGHFCGVGKESNHRLCCPCDDMKQPSK